MKAFGGVCYPAHIDRDANGILAVLGFFPPSPKFDCIEIRNPENSESLIEKHNLQGKRVIISSDAHYLWGIKEQKEYFLLEDEPYSSALVRKKLFEYLKG